MYRLTVLLPIFVIAACATSAPAPQSILASTARPIAPAAPVVTSALAAAKSVEIDDIESGLICSWRDRPGSHIAEKYCYTREERAANAEAQEETVRLQMEAIRREQQMREMWERQQEEARQRAIIMRGTGQ